VRRDLASAQHARHLVTALGGETILIITHQVVALCLRYLLEGMDEAKLLAIDRDGDVENCAITEYRRGDCGLALKRYNFSAAVAPEAAVTTAPDKKASGA
jgi:broad specificity phosphatase PhoE